MEIIARIRTEFPTKFGIPRQSGLVDELLGTIVFEPAYRVPEAVRGLDGFSHLWLLWQFSAAVRPSWSPTVRPPRLGGNVRMGVFATRSPFRPNPIGLSCVRLVRMEAQTSEGPKLYVAGADLMDGTPIYDIKPYLPYADCHPEARGGFADDHQNDRLTVEISAELEAKVPAERRTALRAVLAQDPRPAYQDNPERQYGLPFAGLEIGFSVRGGVLRVERVEPAVKKDESAQ